MFGAVNFAFNEVWMIGVKSKGLFFYGFILVQGFSDFVQEMLNLMSDVKKEVRSSLHCRPCVTARS